MLGENPSAAGDALASTGYALPLLKFQGALPLSARDMSVQKS